MAFGLRIPSFQDITGAASTAVSFVARPFVAVAGYAGSALGFAHQTIASVATATQRNAWYTPSDIMVAARRDLLEFEEVITTEPFNADAFNQAVARLQNTYRDMRIQFATFEDYYALSIQERGAIRRFTAYIDRPMSIVASEQSFALFKVAFGEVLAISERWGEPHGPINHLKKRASNLHHRLFHRQTEAERESEHLIGSLSRGQNDRRGVELLVRNLDRVIHERCADGIGSHNVRELSSLLLLQGQLEDLLSPQRGLADGPLLGQVALVAQSAPTHLIKRGYRPNLTLREPPRLIEDTRDALVNALAAPARLPVARQRVDRLLTIYANRSPSLLAPLRVVSEARAPTREQLQAAGEAVVALGSEELGWFRSRQPLRAERATVSFQVDYMPEQQIVDASFTLNRLRVLPDQFFAGNAPSAAGQLRHLLAWLRQDEQSHVFSAYFRQQISVLERQLASGDIDQVDGPLFQFVQERLNFWGQPSRLNRWLFGEGAHPSLDSVVMQPLRAAYQTCQVVTAGLGALDNRAAIRLLPQYGAELARLRDELRARCLPVSEEAIERFERDFTAMSRALTTPRWNEQERTREQVIRQAQALAQTLHWMVDSSTARRALPQPQRAGQDAIARRDGSSGAVVRSGGSSSAAARAPSSGSASESRRRVFAEEFHELLQRLTGLDQALQHRNPDEILHWTRSAWAFTQAILEQHDGNHQLIAQHYQLPLRTIQAFAHLADMLERAIVLHPRGGCDPDSENFVFAQLLLEDNRTLVPSRAESIRRQAFGFLHDWRQNERSLGLMASATQWTMTRVVGEAPRRLDLPRPPAALLERANDLLVMTLSNAEVRREAAIVIPLLRGLTTAQKREMQRPLLQLMQPRHPPEAMGIARRALADCFQYLRAQSDRSEAAELERQENARALDSRGLMGRGLTAIMGAAESAGLAQGGTVHNALRRGLTGVASAVSHRAHRATSASTPAAASSSSASGREGTSATARATRNSTSGGGGSVGGSVRSAIRSGATLLNLDEATTQGIESAVETGMGALGIGESGNDEGAAAAPSSRTRARDGSAELFELQAETEEAANFNITGPAKKVTAAELTAEKDLFVQNNSAFVPMKVLYEYVAGLPSQSTEFYGEIIQKARAAGPAKEYDVLKEAFIEELGKANVNWLLSTIIGWILFPIFYRLAKRYFKIFADRGLEWAKDFIEKNNKDASSAFANRAVDRTNRALATLQSAYRRIGENPNITGNLEDELQTELKKPQFNHGMTPDELHQASASALIDKFIAPGILQWSRSLREACSEWHPFESGVADTVLNAVAVAFSWLASIPILLIEWPLRQTVLLFVKRYIVNGQLVGTLVGASVQSIEKNGYTHALNCVLYDQLKDVYMTLQRHFSVGPRDRDDEEEDVDLKKYTIVDRDKLRTLVKELFSVLEKHRCRTPEELRRLIHNDSFLKKLQGDIENYGYDKAVGSIENVIRAILHSVLKKDQLEKQFYQLMTTINGIYKKGQAIPESEFQKKEDAINRIIEAILTLVIDKGLDQVADFEREHEQKGVNGFSEEIVELAKGLNKDLKSAFRRLNQRAEMNEGRLPSTTATEDQLRDMVAKANAFLNKLIDWRNRVQSSESGLSSEGKAELLAMEQNLRDQVNAMIRSLNAIYRPRARMSLGERMADFIERFKEILASIIRAITGEKQRDLSGKVRRLNDLLKNIERQPALADQVSILKEELERLETLIRERQEIERIRNSLREEDPRHDEIVLDLQVREERLETTTQALENKCHAALDACSFDEETSPDDAWADVQQGVENLKQWVEAPPEIRLASDSSFLRPVKEWAVQRGKDFIIDRVRNKSDGLLSLIRDPIVWHHGLYNHNILFPLIGKG